MLFRQNSTKNNNNKWYISHSRGGENLKSKILLGKELSKFCEELNIKKPLKILLKINGKNAEYYNSNDDTYHKLNLEIAKKYIY